MKLYISGMKNIFIAIINIASAACLIIVLSGFSGHHHVSVAGGGMAHPVSIQPSAPHPVQMHPISAHPMSNSQQNFTPNNFGHHEFGGHEEMHPHVYVLNPSPVTNNSGKQRVGFSGSGYSSAVSDWPGNQPQVQPNYSPLSNANGYIQNGRLHIYHRPQNSQEYLAQHDQWEDMQSGYGAPHLLVAVGYDSY